MKKILIIFATAVVALWGVILFYPSPKPIVIPHIERPKYQITNLVGQPMDYTDSNNWMFLETNSTHPVDLVYFYPTVAFTSPSGPLATLDDDLKEKAKSAYNMSGSAFQEYTNIYAPYYRQIPLETALKTPQIKFYEDLAKNSELRTDVYAALDTYFKNYNQGKPFILAGHSQGSMVLKMILADYMKAHPEYLKKMVAAYAIGFAVPQEWLDQNKHIKFAEKEDDVGVIISWNTEGPNATQPNMVVGQGAVVINPLNWKRDETPASVQENKGSLITKNPITVGAGVADARIDLKRGALICTTHNDYVHYPAFGDKSLHTHDYGFYYNNIKENGKKRIDAYFKQHKQ